MKVISHKLLYEVADLFEYLSKKCVGLAQKLTIKENASAQFCSLNWEKLTSCYVLSTGRCGTKLLNQILLISHNSYPVHKPIPELISSSKRAYETLSHNPEIYEETFRASREDYLLHAAVRDKIYIETNNKITFFAPVIKDILPNSIFIHLVRHPGDFVRSGIRRKWYSDNHDYDYGRIHPITNPVNERWDHFNQIEKIGWLWNETNQYIENFKKELPAKRIIFVKAEDLFDNIEVSREIYKFIGLNDFNEKVISKLIKKPVNAQSKGIFPKYRDWDESAKAQLRAVAKLATKYNYAL